MLAEVDTQNMRLISLSKSTAFALRAMTLVVAAALIFIVASGSIVAQEGANLTPLQRRIEKERQRLNSSDIEERRDALMKLGSMKRPEASRAAVGALNDVEPAVRVTAAHAIASLPAEEAAGLLIPLLKDKLEFVRREVAYALGETRSHSAVGALTELLSADKESGVRAAAVVALGQIKDESAVPALTQVLSGTSGKKKSKVFENEFVLRAAAQALGEIRSRAGVNVLVAALGNEMNPTDVRRAAAKSLGLIGDQTAIPALQVALASDDPYLSQAAREALRRLRALQP